MSEKSFLDRAADYAYPSDQAGINQSSKQQRRSPPARSAAHRDRDQRVPVRVVWRMLVSAAHPSSLAESPVARLVVLEPLLKKADCSSLRPWNPYSQPARLA